LIAELYTLYPPKMFSRFSRLAILFASASAGGAKPSLRGEIWSAFFAFNASDPSCDSDAVGARLFAARFAPAAPDAAWRHSLVDVTDALAPLQPIHSKTLTFGGGATMAVDAAGRRAWALLGTSDWTPHSWVVQLAFPKGDFNSTRLVGACEIVNSSMAQATYTMQGLTYSATVVKGGGAYFLSADPAQYYSGNVSVVTVPQFDPKAARVPPCRLTNVSTIVSAGAFSPFIIPLPIRGSDRRGNPLVVELARNAANSSQVAVQAWSALTGRLVYNVTWACGSPSYLYSCPPTNAGIPNGLNAAFMARGTLFFGGGPWSSQQYFQASIPALALAEEGGGDDGDGGGGGDAPADVPVLTFVNASSDQGTWLASSTGAFAAGAAPNGWPLVLQDAAGSSGACVRPQYTSDIISTAVSRDGRSVASTTVGNGDGTNPGCPFRAAQIPGWFATCACAGASYGFPDNLLA